jgi:DNA polymerase
MSQSARSSIFLDEMGVGAQWKLRNVATPPDGELAEEGAGASAAPVASVPPAGPELHAAAQPAARPDPAVAPHADDAAPPVGRLVAAVEAHDADAVPPAAPPAPRKTPPAELHSAAADAATHPAPLAESSQPADSTPSAPEDDSTSWFDDAPAPARAAPVSDEAIAAMDWPTLKTAVATCTRCTLCETRRNAVNGRGAADASWIAIAAAPSRLDEKDKQPVTAEAGQLLDNMLKAISLKPDADVYVTHLVKCRPANPDGSDRAPSVDELTACRPYLHRELALTGATMAMTFGQFAAKGLMMGPAARGKVMRYGDAQLPVVATYHPDDLLRKPEDKAKAWGDLCLAKAARD